MCDLDAVGAIVTDNPCPCLIQLCSGAGVDLIDADKDDVAQVVTGGANRHRQTPIQVP